MEDNPLLLSELIYHRRVMTHFQPLVSIKKRCVIGLEALCRGFHPSTAVLIPPQQLFQEAIIQGCTLALDRLCRQTSLDAFRPHHAADADLLLFLNFDTSVIDQGVVGSDHLLSAIHRSGIHPGNVVIELIESRVHDLAALHRFVQTYREYGFLIALDDIGSGHSNLDRIPLLKPDILKIDRSLISGIHHEAYKQIVCRSLVSLAQQMGALVVAEGIECREEALRMIELGADVLQGYYFAQPDIWNGIPTLCQQRIERLALTAKTELIGKITALRSRHRFYRTLCSRIAERLAAITVAEFDGKMAELLEQFSCVECLYILNGAGIQVSETIGSTACRHPRQRSIFRPAKRGTDHSLKEYYYRLLGADSQQHTTDPYVSLASGNRCITISAPFHDSAGKEYILCIDINPEARIPLTP